MVVIEHHLDVVKTADWLIDLGPEGGDGGGEIVAQGTPEQIARVRASYTGRYLAPLLKLAPPRRVEHGRISDLTTLTPRVNVRLAKGCVRGDNVRRPIVAESMQLQEGVGQALGRREREEAPPAA